jgi:hypothetical protein
MVTDVAGRIILFKLAPIPYLFQFISDGVTGVLARSAMSQL